MSAGVQSPSLAGFHDHSFDFARKRRIAVSVFALPAQQADRRSSPPRSRRHRRPPAPAATAPARRLSPLTISVTRRRSSSPAGARAVRSSATSRPRTRWTRATSARPARPTSTNCSTRLRRRSAARAAAAASAPVLLLNGQRISGFRELRDIPTEAIQRVDILPEEVALKYGYRADQKVVNIVLRPRFRSTTVQVGAGLRPTAAMGTATAISPACSSSVMAARPTIFMPKAIAADRDRARHPSRPDPDRRALSTRAACRALAGRHQARCARIGDDQPPGFRGRFGHVQCRARA